MATSASAMPPMTLSICDLVRALGELVKATMTPMTVPRRPTNGRVVAQRAEQGHPALELAPALDHLAVDARAERVRAALGPAERVEEHLGLDGFVPAEQPLGPGPIALLEEVAEGVAHLFAAGPSFAEEPPPFEHHGDRRHAEREQHVHDPRAAEQGHFQEIFYDHDAIPFLLLLLLLLLSLLSLPLTAR